MKQYIVIGALVGLFVLPQAVFASPIVRSGDSVTISADQVLESDFYGFGKVINLSGVADEDVYVAAGSVTVTAPVAGDLSVLAESVQVHAAVDDDVRIVGGTVVLAKPVKGDVVVLGGSLTILSTGSVEGDVLFLAGSATIEGPVTGSILGTADTVRIDTHVGGNVDVRAVSGLSLGDRTDIVGNVMYSSVTELVRAQDASIGGTVQKATIAAPAQGSVIRDLVLQTLIMLFAALTAFLMVRPVINHIVGSATFSYGTHALVGIGVCIAAPFISILLMASILGSIVGVLLLCAYILLMISAWVLTGIVLGNKVQQMLFKKEETTILTVVFGTVLFNAAMLIPFVGIFIALSLSLIVFGSIVLSGYRALR
jgi:hypothetical protein